MKRYALVFATVIGAAVAFQGSVNLQTATPGTAQTGHLNVTGTARAGLMVGYSTTPTGIAFGGDFRSTSTSGRGVLGSASATSGATYGGLFQSFSNAGRGVAGIAQNATGNTYGGFFSCLSVAGYGVYGQATAASGTTYGVYGKAVSPNGYGVYSEGDLYSSGKVTAGTGVVAQGSPALQAIGGTAVQAIAGANGISFDGTGQARILTNRADNAPTIEITNGAARYGSNFSYQRVAIQGAAVGTGYACGVYGVGNATTQDSYGVVGVGGGTPSNAIGVYGLSFGASNVNYAGFFQRLLYAASASSGVKAFLIDHPVNPANMTLEHSSVESDQRMNLYRGLVITDARGYATVTLPSWFEALNEEFMYQLTIMDEANTDSFVLAKVIQNVRNGKFRIRTSEPKVKVSWLITGVRHDPTSEHFPLQVEREKRGSARGKYLVPEAYGKDDSFAIIRPPHREGSSNR